MGVNSFTHIEIDSKATERESASDHDESATSDLRNGDNRGEQN